MAWSGWLTADEAVEAPYWPTCELDDLALAALLISAQQQCEVYAPAVAHAGSVAGAAVTETGDDGVPIDALVPESWRQAHALQARALHRSAISGAGDQIGGDGLTVTVFPMDWTVKALLRPRSGVPRLG